MSVSVRESIRPMVLCYVGVGHGGQEGGLNSRI